MANLLVPCPACGAMIGNQSRTCLQCGQPVNLGRRLLREIKVQLVILAIGMLMVGAFWWYWSNVFAPSFLKTLEKTLPVAPASSARPHTVAPASLGSPGSRQ